MYEAASDNKKHLGLTPSACKNGTASPPQRSISSCTTNLAFSSTRSIGIEASTSENWIAFEKLRIYKTEESKSEELVPLLQERDAMLDEIEARNVSIEQLLKLTGTSKI
ncbi:uncharacterized protein LOC143233370 isoform X2 [Tachypleus tridentatus]|uniref:uncharacterized protein LOC143233370 isoform X2 n=1 Tax=Tachypleus tridentatus TaxID=6853 RepID=UPI003FD627A9